ncbi:MAG: FeoB-associated Cys-rich membrane protein [Oscillospiraceae bacterium]|nr:FeoB-associated Cys-rich membrane protein [Oscillospiraceae bacterium]
MNKLILGICIGLILLGIVIFIIYIKKMLSGKCCEGCKSCSQKNNCRNFEDKK